jgi:DNA-binding NtrC family response regulator
LLDNLEVRMSNFVTLLVEDDASQREAFADLLKDEGFEVIECTTAEAAELIIASTGTELQALITDQNLAGNDRGTACAICSPPAPGYEHHHYVRQHREAYTGQHHVLTKAPLTAAQLLEAVRD